MPLGVFPFLEVFLIFIYLCRVFFFTLVVKKLTKADIYVNELVHGFIFVHLFV